jgi:hypothetical protein
MKIKRGTVREDGMVFMHMVRGKEYWATQEKYAELKHRDKKAQSKLRHDNPELISIRQKQWRDSNPEKAKENLRKWRKKNKDYVNQKVREWNKNNPSKIRERILKRRIKDLDGYNAIKRMASAKRRAIKMERLHVDHDFEIEKVLTNQCKSLYNRLGIKFEVDHIVALADGGWHHHTNLHVIPLTWNRRKHTKDLSSIPSCWNPFII